MADYSNERLRAFEPDGAPHVQMGSQVEVTISLDSELYEWARGISGRDSFFSCVEETIVTALRSMAGKDISTGLDLAQLADLVAAHRRVSMAEAMFGGLADAEATETLLEAAHLAARGLESDEETPHPESRAVAAWSAAAGRDVASEIGARVKLAATEDRGAGVISRAGGAE